MLSANLSAIFYLVSGVLFILALRGLSSPETSRQGNLFGILGMIIAVSVTFLSIGNFSTGFVVVLIFLLIGGLIGAFIAYKIPMMMTAAGTIPAAKVLVVGAGVAGLQAIATAKRMGAIVFATDVRMASKEQVESLGGKFLTVEGAENLETEGGYAKEASDDFKKKQEELLSETLKKIDIVICTALIPGKKAPVIIKEGMINNMSSGSIIYDLAAIQGGNTAHTKVDEIVDSNGVKIMGESNILNKLPISASNLYAKNVFNFVSNLYDKENNKININLEDEIIEKTLIK